MAYCDGWRMACAIGALGLLPACVGAGLTHAAAEPGSGSGAPALGDRAVQMTKGRAGGQARAYPVAALRCAADPALCRALVQALSEAHPGHLYRINPDPEPPDAFDLRISVSASGAIRLHWDSGASARVPRAGRSDADFARAIIAAAAGLVPALRAAEARFHSF